MVVKRFCVECFKTGQSRNTTSFWVKNQIERVLWNTVGFFQREIKNHIELGVNTDLYGFMRNNL